MSYHDPDAGLSDEDRSSVPMELESDAEVEADGNEEDAEAEVELLRPSPLQCFTRSVPIRGSSFTLRLGIFPTSTQPD